MYFGYVLVYDDLLVTEYIHLGKIIVFLIDQVNLVIFVLNKLSSIYTSTKLNVVFDTSAKSSHNEELVKLND